MQHSLLPTGGAVENLSLHCWSLISPGMKTLYVNPAPISVLASLECLCTSSPVDVCLWFPHFCFLHLLLINCKLIGLDTLLSSSFITLHQLSLSLPLVPLCNGTKALLGMAWHLLAHFVPSSFYVESFGKKLIWVSFLIYLFLWFSFWVIQTNVGLTSLQTVACCYFIVFLGSTTATSYYSTAGRAASTDTDIPLPLEETWGWTDGSSQVSALPLNCVIHTIRVDGRDKCWLIMASPKKYDCIVLEMSVSTFMEQ